MKFELEQLAGCQSFEPCRFYTPIEGKRISRLVLIGSPAQETWAPEALLLVCRYVLPKEEPALEACLREMAARKTAGFLLDPSCADEEWILKLQHTCLNLNLVFGTMPSDLWTSAIQEFDRLIASRTDGKVKPCDQVLEDLQHQFCTRGTEALLGELSYWTGCQAALIVGQDTFVYPPTPILDEAIFYPAYWHKEPLKPAPSHVSLYTSSYSQQKLLQAKLYKNRLPFGALCLIAEGNKKGCQAEPCFEPLDSILLNYAAILCTGINDYKRRSRRIEAAIERFCRGETPDSSELELFPSSGRAFVLLDQEGEAKLLQKGEPEGKQDYLSYLLHHYFPQKLCYSFAPDGSLRLFVSTGDTDHFGRKLLTILDRTGRHYRAGISRHYEISQAATAFSEAGNAAHIAQLLEYEERLCHYHDLGIYRLLNYPENSWPVNQMLGEMDELLNQMDEEKRNMLAMTIRVFVNCNFSYQKTADRLYTHVNTVRYRIRLIEDLWDVDLSSDEGRLLFGVLAKLLPLWMKSGCYSGAMPKDGENCKN